MTRTRSHAGQTRPRTVLCLLPVVLLAILLVAPPLMAQKTPKPEKSKPAQVQQTTFKEVLVKYEGKTTNLGTLKKIAGDYFVLDQEGTVSMHPLHAIHTLRLVKDEETGETQLEIVLVAKD